MNYQITSDNIEMSPSMEALAHEKMKKLEGRLTHVPEDLKSVRIVMNSAKEDQFTAKVFAVIHGKEYFSEENSYTLEHALIAAIANVERELEKGKIISTEEEWNEARKAKRFDPGDAEEVEEEISQ